MSDTPAPTPNVQTVLDNISASEYGVDPIVISRGETALGTYLAENMKVDEEIQTTQKKKNGIVTGEAVTITHVVGSTTVTVGSDPVPQIGDTFPVPYKSATLAVKITKVGESRAPSEIMKVDITFSRKLGTITTIAESV